MVFRGLGAPADVLFIAIDNCLLSYRVEALKGIRLESLLHIRIINLAQVLVINRLKVALRLIPARHGVFSALCKIALLWVVQRCLYFLVVSVKLFISLCFYNRVTVISLNLDRAVCKLAPGLQGPVHDILVIK